MIILCGCSDSNQNSISQTADSTIDSKEDVTQSTNTITITSQSVTFDIKNSAMLFATNVSASNHFLVITSDNMFLQISSTKEAELLRAEGNTRLTTPIMQASAQDVDYWPAKEQVILGQQVVMNQPNRSVSADQIVLFMSGGAFVHAQGTGKVHVSFPAKPRLMTNQKQFIHVHGKNYWESGHETTGNLAEP